MSLDSNLMTITLAAAADYSTTGIYLAVNVDSAGKAVTISSTGGIGVGILQNNPKSGAPATVAIEGVAKWQAGATIAAGAKVSSTSAGKAVTSGSGNTVLGTALIAGVDGDIISVLLHPTPVLA